ncbi:hypothetical protein O181_004447 [Austropuccinia psidii MF-1]|uniref:Integrase catalytic domain-containing protein n=1 Tax=Austropuccinia psidii MF-1 TaxID=1389203 RepID=A0A9Q3BGT8_9BASI|nr:hypothetical protein [Austropuccinia psidii MF-1]
MRKISVILEYSKKLSPLLLSFPISILIYHALGAVLSQVSDSGKHPTAFDSFKLLPDELNYLVHYRELLGIVWALKCWRDFLLSLSNCFEVLKDHTSLQYFMSSKVLTCHQAYLAKFLSEFHFTITSPPGRLPTSTDSFLCWANVYPERGMDFIRKKPQSFHQVIKQDVVQESRFFSIKVEIFSDLVDQIQKEVWQDKDYKEILKKLARGESVSDYSLEPQVKLLLFNDRVVIPRNKEIQLNIIQKSHYSPLTGHPGQEKTLKLIKRDFYWAGMNKFIKEYVPSLVVERFSNMEIFIPAYEKITSLDLAQIFINHVFSKHGLPASIVCNRGSLFVSSFWTKLCQKLKISRDLSTDFHPETDGQTERVNQIIEQYLWITLINKAITIFTIYVRNTSFDSIHISQDSPAGELSTKLQSVQQLVKVKLESEIRRFKKYADRNRKIPPDFQPGDKVRLASKSIKTTRPTKKLSERWLGPS